MITADLLGVPAVAGIVQFSFRRSNGEAFPICSLPSELMMFQEISGVSVMNVSPENLCQGSVGSGDVALAVALAVLREVMTRHPLVLDINKIDRFGYVSVVAEAISGGSILSTNTSVTISAHALREPRYLAYKTWLDALPHCLAEQRFRFRLHFEFFGSAFYASDPRLGLLGALAHLVRECATRAGLIR